MGRNDKRYSIPLEKQAYEKLKTMIHFGESKKVAKLDGTMKYKIFSINTFKVYKREIEKFCMYIQENHPKCTTLDVAKKYVNEWLEYRESEGLSAWTIQLEAKALGKLYCIRPEDDDYYKPPVRRRVDIKRSRYPTKRDQLFNEEKNEMLIMYCKSSGQRRSEVEKAKPEDLITKKQIEDEIKYLSSQKPSIETINRLKILKDTRCFDEEYYLYTKGKGGRERFAPIVGEYTEEVVKFINDLKGVRKHIWISVSEYADIHSYRSDYANTIYKKYARNINDIPKDKVRGGINQMYQSEVYCCRNDRKGEKFDKQAMLICSKALGHSRVEVVANNYLRGI